MIENSSSYYYSSLSSNKENLTSSEEELGKNKISEKKSHLNKSSSSLSLVQRMDLDIEHFPLHALVEKISFPTIMKLLELEETDENKRVLLNTFIKIEEVISSEEFIHSDAPQKYYKKSKNAQNQLISYAFGINNKNIYLSGKYLGKGAYKWVNSAYRINNFIGQNFLQQVEPYVRIKPHPDLFAEYKEYGNAALGLINGDLICESKAMQLLKDNPYAVRPSKFLGCSVSKKAIFFQKKYSGTGTMLFNACFKHQLKALKDLGLALALLQEKGYVHMDIKPDNLFILGDVDSEEGVIEGKMADIGLMKEIGKGDVDGSPIYLPPEIVKIEHCIQPDGKTDLKPIYMKEQTAHPKIDSYSYGLTILEIILPQAIKNQIYMRNFSCEDQNKLSVHFDTKHCPIFTQLDNQFEFDKQVDNFLRLAHQFLQNSADPEVEKRIRVLNICRELIRFDASERMTCAAAAAALLEI